MENSELHWFKSSLSTPNGDCVEAAALPDGGMALRNSRDPEGGTLRFTEKEWACFAGGVRAGEFEAR
jgi:Domain of unknown function (DUF397)